MRGRKNRRRPVSLWSRVPRPRALVDACGRAVRRSTAQLAAAAVLALVAFGLWVGYRFIATSPRFAIEDIQVHGAHRLSADAIRESLPVGVGDNVFGANLDRIGANLRRHPWIAAAEARRILPHTLVIDIREYEAAAVAQFGDARYLIDTTGHAFKRVEAAEGDGLPLVTGIDRGAYDRDPDGTALAITSALDVLAVWRSEPRPAITEVHVDARGAVSLRGDGVSIQLGRVEISKPPTSDLDARMRTFDAAWAELSETERGRARAVYLLAEGRRLDARVDLVTVAFKD